MDIQRKDGGAYTLLAFTGRLDAISSPAAEQKINETIGAGAAKLVLDLSSLDYVSSAGLRVLLATAKKLSRQNGQLTLCGLQPSVREVFEISGFLAIFKVVATAAEA